MMKTIFLLLAVAGALSVNAQVKKQNADTTKKVFTIVEDMPQFPGGDDAMLNYMKQNIKPVCSSGKVYVSFVVDTTGAIIRPVVLRGISPECDAEALRVVHSMPAWKPGRQNGRLVQVQYNLPVNFGK